MPNKHHDSVNLVRQADTVRNWRENFVPPPQEPETMLGKLEKYGTGSLITAPTGFSAIKGQTPVQKKSKSPRRESLSAFFCHSIDESVTSNKFGRGADDRYVTLGNFGGSVYRKK